MTLPLVSIKMLAYNHENYIRQAIESCVMQQTSFPYELVVIDDASQDRTPQIIQGYADSHPEKIVPVLLVENQQSKGRQFSIDSVLRHCQGKYIAFCEGDDYWTDPLKLEKQISLMEADPSVSMCFTAAWREYLDASRKPHIKRYHRGDFCFPPRDVIQRLGSFADMVTVVVRKDIYLDIPEWYYLSPVGDVPIYLLAMLKGKVCYEDTTTAVHQSKVANSWTQSMDQDGQRKAAVLKKMIAMLQAFDLETSFQYHAFVERRLNTHRIDLQVFYEAYAENCKEDFSNFGLREHLEFNFFKYLRSQTLWNKYQSLLRMLRIY